VNPLALLASIPPGWLALPAVGAIALAFTAWDEIECRRREGRPLAPVFYFPLLILGIGLGVLGLSFLIRAAVL